MDKTTNGKEPKISDIMFQRMLEIGRAKWQKDIDNVDKMINSPLISNEQKFYLMQFRKMEERNAALNENFITTWKMLEDSWETLRKTLERLESIEKIVNDLAQKKDVDMVEVQKLNKAINSKEFQTMYQFVKDIQEQIAVRAKKREENDLAT